MSVCLLSQAGKVGRSPALEQRSIRESCIQQRASVRSIHATDGSVSTWPQPNITMTIPGAVSDTTAVTARLRTPRSSMNGLDVVPFRSRDHFGTTLPPNNVHHLVYPTENAGLVADRRQRSRACVSCATPLALRKTGFLREEQPKACP